MSSRNRIENRFAALGASGRCALITYVTAGDPDAASTLEIMRALVRAGTDVIELGVPFSDPMADGPVIQRASERALENGMSLAGVLEIVRQFRQEDSETPLVLMGYLNPIEAMGYENFARAGAQAGIDGALVVDIPPEESQQLNACMAEDGLDQIFLIAPNSPPERIDGVCEFARGFVYYVSVKGVTGGKKIDTHEVGEHIAEFRQRLSLPIGVGFGIKSAQSAAAVANAGDAVIVGSAIIEIIERESSDSAAMMEALHQFVGGLRTALDDARTTSTD